MHSSGLFPLVLLLSEIFPTRKFVHGAITQRNTTDGMINLRFVIGANFSVVIRLTLCGEAQQEQLRKSKDLDQ